jgi:hypothetical protein
MNFCAERKYKYLSPGSLRPLGVTADAASA